MMTMMTTTTTTTTTCGANEDDSLDDVNNTDDIVEMAAAPTHIHFIIPSSIFNIMVVVFTPVHSLVGWLVGWLPYTYTFKRIVKQSSTLSFTSAIIIIMGCVKSEECKAGLMKTTVRKRNKKKTTYKSQLSKNADEKTNSALVIMVVVFTPVHSLVGWLVGWLVDE
uniref:Uncharacterized protein n=1 Tax=Glossina brevipalpis TaxID=37001 RepID=A0A1A9WAN8_9MUSC